MFKRLAVCLVIVITLTLPHTGRSAEFKVGLEAYNNSDFDLALSELLPLAKKGNAEAQYYVGKIYKIRKPNTPENDRKAVKWFGKSANQGNAKGQNALGFMYSSGKGVPEDDEEAVKWYRKAADQGNAQAQLNLGWMHDRGEGVPEDDEEAVKWYRKAADQGNALAQLNLGWMHDRGEGIPEDDDEAVRWYRKAADQGNAQAQRNMGIMNSFGLGVPTNYQIAIKWYRKAADQGDALAQHYLGHMYDYGKGVPEDDKEAVKWYRKAADQGNPEAQINLGDMYNHGYGVPTDHQEALKWFRKAAAQGDHTAQNNLGWFYHQGIGTPRNYEEARKWYLKAAKGNDHYAQDNLGLLYQNGLGVAVAFKEAVRWYRLAADQENEWGLLHLANMYRRGMGVKRDYVKARELYVKAAKKGMIEAHVQLAELYELGLGVKRNLKTSAEWLKKSQSVSKGYEDVGADGLGVKRHSKHARALLREIERDIKASHDQKREQKDLRYTNVKFGTYHALVIGNNDYRTLKKLNTAVNDATAVADLLGSKYGFKTKLLINATRARTIKTLNRLGNTLGKNDNLLIYYAGHGALDKNTNHGFWQPVDAEKTDDAEWISNDRVTRTVAGISANHVMIVADSCFSGTVHRGLSMPSHSSQDDDYYKGIVEQRARVALTSGGNEPVADAIYGSRHSVFAKTFINILKNNSSVLTAAQLSETLKKRVSVEMRSNKRNQTPEYSHMYNAGHDGGDFLFVPKVLVRQN